MTNRLSKLLSLMSQQGFDAVLVSSVPNIIYLTNLSHFSIHEREAFLFVTQTKNYILTDGRYSTAVKNNIKNFELIEISPELSFEKAIKKLAKKHKIRKIGLEEHNLTHYEYKTISNYFNTAQYFSIYSIRIIKDKNEINSIEKACGLGDETFKHILLKIKEGVSEKELAFEIEFFIKKQGADISFPPIVAFGKNSAIPHHKSTHNSKLITHNFVLLDFGVRMNNYCSDMTRTVFFGKATSEQKRMYQTVLEAQQKATEYLKNNYSSSEVRSTKSRSSRLANARSNNKVKTTNIDKVARDYIISKGYPTIPHSLGHGIGLEVHEAPILSPKSPPKADQALTDKDILKPGMVFTIEPGIYISNFGGVRIEDVVVLKETGPRLLTKSSKGIIEID